MKTNRWNLALGLGLILAAVLACNFNFSTANISSLKIGKDEKVATETSSFKPTDTVYIVAEISNTSDKHKIRCRVLFDEVEDQKSGEVVPGAEKDIELPGSGTAMFNFRIPGGGWPNGRYKVEASMLNEGGEQKDQKTATFEVSGGSAGKSSSDESASKSTSGEGGSKTTFTDADISISQLADFGEPAGPANGSFEIKRAVTNINESTADPVSNFSTGDTIYVVTEVSNMPYASELACRLLVDQSDEFKPGQVSKYTLTVREKDGFTGDAYYGFSAKPGWPKGTYKAELYFAPEAGYEQELQKTLALRVQ